jgi:hypothetical protein
MNPVVCWALVTLSLAPSMATAQAGSKRYQTASRQEASASKQAQVSIYPQDVRDSLTAYEHTVVAWPGVLLHVDTITGTDSVRLVLEHHYFDWREDHGLQRELYFLSPRGEGLLTTVVPAHWIAGRGFAGEPSVGSMILLYGTPIALDTMGSQVAVRISTAAANAIERQWYRTDVFSYGRDFSDFKFLGMPH